MLYRFFFFFKFGKCRNEAPVKPVYVIQICKYFFSAGDKKNHPAPFFTPSLKRCSLPSLEHTEFRDTIFLKKRCINLMCMCMYLCELLCVMCMLRSEDRAGFPETRVTGIVSCLHGVLGS